MDHFKEDEAGEFIEDAIPLPQKVRRLILAPLILHVDRPEFFRHELLDLLMSLDYEAKRGKLAGPIAHHSLLIDRVSQQERLKPRKRGPNPQIDLLAHVDGFG